MLDINHRKPTRTVSIVIAILLVTLVFISNKIYSDIRGEFAKRPTSLPPEPAAVVNYLKEDLSNIRALSSTICTPGMTITVDLSQLGATPTFFEAIDLALANAGMTGFTSKDFLEPQPDSISTMAYPQTFASNMYYYPNNIHIDANVTNIHFALTTILNNDAQPPGEFKCTDLFSGGTQLCEVLSSCGMTYDNKVRIGGCLVTTNNPDLVSSIKTALNPNMVVETLTYVIPRRNVYFVNPYFGSDYSVYTQLANHDHGNVIGCSDPSLDTTTVCGSGGTKNLTNIPHYELDSLSASPSIASVTAVALSKVPRQEYILAFKIEKCPTS